MSDPALALSWGALLVAGLILVSALRRHGVATTYTRDMIHISAGVWVLGWPAWGSWHVPVAIPILAVGAAALVRRAPFAWARRVRDALAGGDEQWAGVALYIVAFAALTSVGFADAFFPAGAALLALSLGDGFGGAVGRRFGAHFFAAPGGKRKSLEGSATVAILASVATLIAGARFGVHIRPMVVAGTGVLAAAVEGASPRGTDNLLLPIAVWSFVRMLT